MLPDSIDLPPELLNGAHVVSSRPTMRYIASLPGCPAFSLVMGLTVFDLSDGRRVFCCTELADNPGRSVTNAWPELAQDLLNEVGYVDWENAVFVEHYFPGSYEEMRSGEIYDLVEIDFIAGGFPQTKWRRLQSETTREIPRFKGVAENG